MEGEGERDRKGRGLPPLSNFWLAISNAKIYFVIK